MGEPETLRPVGVDMPTEVTVPLPAPAHWPLGILKQPVASWMPLAKVEEAVTEVTFKRLVWMPPAYVEVAEEVETMYEVLR